ncbi:MAG TPA: hypothetical protein VGH20_17025 [Myxococcales bacterium]
MSGADGVVEPGALVIFGELHGTDQIPAFVGDVAVAAARKGRVHVGLELPVGDEPGKTALWHGPAQYGVSSRAMLGLIERLRAAGIDVYFFDDRSLGMDHRDETMAAAIARHRALAPGDIHLVLVGNYHARKAIGAPWDPQKRWMASYLAGPRVVTLDVSYPSATVWSCLQTATGQDCGIHELKKSASASPRGIVLQPNPELGFDGTYSAGPLTASLPAFP